MRRLFILVLSTSAWLLGTHLDTIAQSIGSGTTIYSNSAYKFLAKDFDKDGDLDIVVGTVWCGSCTARLDYLVNDGSNAFTLKTITKVINSYQDHSDIEAADVNGDGFLDVMLVDTYNLTTWIYSPGTNTFLAPTQSITVGYSNVFSTVDVNKDGEVDVINASSAQSWSSLRIVYGQASSSIFSTSTQIVGDQGRGNYAPEAADFNGDGEVDIVLWRSQADGSYAVTMFQNDGTETFTEHVLHSVGSFSSSLAKGDFDNDGDLDLVIFANNGANHSLIIKENPGHGSTTFTSAWTSHALTGPTLTNVRYASGIQVVDADGDGDLDLLVADDASPYNTVLFLNEGGFTFTGTLLGTRIGIPVLADLDGDGSNDLLGLQFGTIKLFGYTAPLTARTDSVVVAAANTVTFHGTVVQSGGESITQRGFVFSGDPAPVLTDNADVKLSVALGSGTGAFSASLDTLRAQTYYVRSFAITSTDTSYGLEVEVANGAYISGTSGFRLLSSPRSGTILPELLRPLWTQGMIGADTRDGDANVWTHNDGTVAESGAPGDWIPVSNLTTTSIGQGQGVLVYVFADTDYDRVSNLPITISVQTAGTENTSDVSISGIANNEWRLAGNPYRTTLDWDLMSQTNLSGSVYVYDYGFSSGYAAGSDDGPDVSTTPVGGWRTWNGTAGSLTGGHIAPYQGFFVRGSGGSGSLTMSASDAADQAGTFYKSPSDALGTSTTIASSPANTGSLSLRLATRTSTSSQLHDEAFLSFNGSGQAGEDTFDALKLLPFSRNERPLLLIEGGDQAWSIANLPWDGAVGEDQDAVSLVLPLQALHLGVAGNGAATPMASEATLAWDATLLPSHVRVHLHDLQTGAIHRLTDRGEHTFTTQAGQPYSNTQGGTSAYPVRGDARFELVVTYSATSTSVEDADREGTSLPTAFTLEQNVPNPFNPSTQIRYSLPQASHVRLEVYNVMGQRVATLVDAPQAAGSHDAVLDATHLSSGVYVYRLTATRSGAGLEAPVNAIGVSSTRSQVTGQTLSRAMMLIK